MTPAQARVGTLLGPDRPGALTPLTGLRWALGLWIVLVHSMFAPVAHRMAEAMPDGSLGAWGLFGAAMVAKYGFIGTNIFMVLGGYALAIGCLDPRTGEMTKTRHAFWRSRAVRFIPLLLLTQVVRIPLLLWRHGDRSAADLAQSIAVNLTGLQAWFPSYVWDLNDPSWTLSVLFFCWALFPRFAPMLMRLSQRQALGAMLACYAYSVLVAGTHTVLRGDADPNYTAQDYWLSLIHTHPLVRMPEFVTGILLARLHRLRAPLLQVPAARLVTAAIAVIALGCASNGVFMPYVMLHNGFLLPAVWALVVGLAELGGSQVAREAVRRSVADRVVAPLIRALSAPAMLRGGAASLSLYLLHGVPIGALIVTRNLVAGRPMFYAGQPTSGHWVELLLAVGYCAVMALVAIHFHERIHVPFTKWLSPRLPGAVGAPTRGSERPMRPAQPTPVTVLPTPLAGVAVVQPAAGGPAQAA